MRAAMFLVSALGIVAMSFSAAGANPRSVSGRTVAFASVTSSVPGEVVSATITRGKPHTVLSIDARVEGYVTGYIYVVIDAPNVSPLLIEPAFTSVQPECSSICPITGQFWVDVDAVEADVPGSLVGKPITIDLYLSGTVTSGTYVGSLRVRMDKK